MGILGQSDQSAIATRLQADPQAQAVIKQWLALNQQAAQRVPGETGAQNYARTQALRNQSTALQSQLKTIASQYVPSGYEVTGIDGSGAPIVSQTQGFLDKYPYVIPAAVAGGVALAPLFAGGAVAGSGGAASSGAAAAGTGGTGVVGAAGGGMSLFGIPARDIFSVGTNLFGNLFGAHEQIAASSQAAQQQSDAAKYAADLQAKANADALAFQKQQSDRDFAIAEANRRANYDQWAVGQRRLGTLGDMLGVGPREIPSYVPLPSMPTAPTASPSMPGSAPASSSAPADFGNLSDPSAWMSLVRDTPRLTQWVQQVSGGKFSPDLVNYYVGKIQQQPGANPTEQAGSAAYWTNEKILRDPVFGGASAPAPTRAGGSPAPAFAPYTPAFAPISVTPGLQMPTVTTLGTYLPRTL